MGFFKNLVSKFPCELCGKEVGALSRTKLKDEKFVCFDCCKDCSAFYPTARYSLDEVKAHIEYMKNMDKFCKDVFDANSNKKDFAKMFSVTGIIFADDLGMFEIIDSNTKKKNNRELFRYNQIWDFKLYGKENTGENVTKKYSETGVKIKIINKLDSDPVINVTNAYDEFKHDYAQEFTIPCSYSSDVLDGGFLIQHLDRIFGIERSYNGPKTINRTQYRKLEEVDQTFNRSEWKNIADEAEKKYFGKAL